MTRTIPSSPNFSTTSMIGCLTIDSFFDQITLGPHIWRFLDGIGYHPAQKPSLCHQATSGSVFLKEIDEEFHIVKDVPIIVMGDFNVDVKKNEKAFGFMKKHFDLNMVPTNYPSSLGNSYIDSTFTRNNNPELLN
ncbi:hypothetical protein AVEN_141163-1 [Araneus ventricosus]|uniref:Endonuclease/exonuclease/phosphatase domain-containing protein n=1 Tax=Araneus ventricosus TaxID=182803 RepID=A0A4Y2SX47_ARAVE|nr:hypothetical protein AVEN_141163-1 [Araneus ventricosus]